jgi:hypothetical protein
MHNSNADGITHLEKRLDYSFAGGFRYKQLFYIASLIL